MLTECRIAYTEYFLCNCNEDDILRHKIEKDENKKMRNLVKHGAKGFKVIRIANACKWALWHVSAPEGSGDPTMSKNLNF